MTSRDAASIRLFRNDALEALTHVHPLVPLLLWGPVAAVLLWRALVRDGLSPLQLLPVAAAALLVWTFTEYALHRFVFHFPARSRAGKWLVFLFHGVHHEAPQDKTRLVMPPAGAIPIMALIWGLFGLLIPAPWMQPFLAFFIVGYLAYDYLHYATHHFPMRHPLLHRLKQHHMKHHFSGVPGRYGVSSPLWDILLRTTGR
jgi:sterol desaturase/sphingolipid hydroxylase (fatty acid hydroxylase superfamily)